MATKKATNNISVRKNRNYADKFPWTAERNEDAYNFYLQAREDPSKGYMRRHKALWDEKYPEHSHVTKEQLLELAVFVLNKIQTQNENRHDDVAEVSQEPQADPQDTAAFTPNSDVEPDNMETNNTDISELTERMKTTFEKHYNEVINQQLNERKYATKVNKKLDNNLSLIHI